MKRFVFFLDRVMAWRDALLRVEETKLEGLRAELHGIESRQAALGQQRVESELNLLAAGAATGLELAALDAFQRFTVAERARLESQRAACRERITAQIQVVTQKRCDVRLLERLKEQRLMAWKADLGREINAEAHEAYLARWNTTSGRE